MTKQIKADLMLVMVTLFWGVSYLLSDICLNYVEPLTLNSYRFVIAFVVAVVISFPKLKNVSWATLKYSALLGVALMFVYITYAFGIKYTSLSNAGFLCALPVVFTPILGFIFKKQRIKRKFFVVMVICVAGIACLTLNADFKPAFGDILCILCAAFYATDLLIAETAVNHADVNPFQVGVFQLGFTGLFTGILAVIIDEPVFPTVPEFWIPVLILAIFCTGAAFIIQILAQQYTTAAHVGVIFTLEPVFAGIVAFLFAGEVLSGRGYFGAFLMLFGLFIMEVNLRDMKITKKVMALLKKGDEIYKK